ncbi:MAG: cation:proton antiporter [Solirubrobacterales bacterium]
MTSFETAAVVLGAVLMGGALLSGLAHRSFLSLTALFVIVGFVLGDGGLHVIELDPESGFVVGLAEVALIVLLFRDGLEVESELLQRAWRLPLRKLAIGMPITAAVVALAARALTDLSWTEAFLLGALLSPTDPVLSSAVVTNPRVPRVVRHSLNLESGLNDGLALPPVLALIAALSLTREDFHVVTFVVQDVGLGLVFGLAVGWLASVLMPRGAGIPAHQKSLYALGVAFATYGVSVLEPHGNGFIAVYVAAIVLGTRRADLRVAFEQRSDDIVELVKLGVFVVFGSLLTLDGLFGEGWASVTIVVVALLVARPLALAVALAGTRLSLPVKAFMAWFGPKGVATMTFSIIVLGAGLANGERIFNLAALVVFVSIIVHSTTDTAGVNWIAHHDAAQREREDRAAGDGERVRPGSE